MPWSKILVIILVVINFSLVYQLLGGNHGISGYRNLKDESESLAQKMLMIEGKNQVLSNEIRLLRNDKTYLAMVIRKEMNFVKPNEVLYLPVKKPD